MVFGFEYRITLDNLSSPDVQLLREEASCLKRVGAVVSRRMGRIEDLWLWPSFSKWCEYRDETRPVLLGLCQPVASEHLHVNEQGA